MSIARRPVGYDRKATDDLLAEVATSFEHVWRERADLRDELEELESELARQKELEEVLRDTLVTAERMADELRAQARREADVIVAEARAIARDIVSGAESERERIRTEIRRLQEVQTGIRADYRAFLLAALDRLDAGTDARPPSHQAA